MNWSYLYDKNSFRLPPQYLQRMYDIAVEKQADMVVCNYTPFRGTPAFGENKANLASVQSARKLAEEGVLTSVGTKLIRASFLSQYNIKFDTKLTYSEDLFFNWKALLASNNVWFVDDKLHGYRVTGNGATAKYHPNLYEKYKAAFSELKEFGKTVGKDDEYTMDLFFATSMPTFVTMTVRGKKGFYDRVNRLQNILDDEIIDGILTEWTQLRDYINPSQISFYEMCRDHNTFGLLVWGYIKEAERQLKRIVGDVIWRRAD